MPELAISGRLAPIFYLKCEHFFFVNNCKTISKKFPDFIKKNRGFSKFIENRTVLEVNI